MAVVAAIFAGPAQAAGGSSGASAADPHAVFPLATQTTLDRLEQGCARRGESVRLDGSDDAGLSAAAYALAGRDPLAATLLFRTLIGWALINSGAGLQVRAARHLAECAALSASITDWEERLDHAGYVIRLRNAYGRRAAFWRRVAKAG